MPRIAKRYKASLEKVEPSKRYSLEEGLDALLSMEKAKYDETVDVAMNLGVDPKQSDQMVRGAVTLPNGLGKKIRVLVFAKGEKEKEAKDAGADFVGGDDLAEKITKENWFDFDSVIATPDMMGTVGKLGRVLGPRGLMPNPKIGTVTFELKKAVRDAKAGKVEYRVEKGGIIHAPIGKLSFGKDKLKENFNALTEAIMKARPAGVKGTYLKKVVLSATHSPGVKLDEKLIAQAYS